jgi:hypothetical protein
VLHDHILIASKYVEDLLAVAGTGVEHVTVGHEKMDYEDDDMSYQGFLSV